MANRLRWILAHVTEHQWKTTTIMRYVPTPLQELHSLMQRTLAAPDGKEIRSNNGFCYRSLLPSLRSYPLSMPRPRLWIT